MISISLSLSLCSLPLLSPIPKALPSIDRNIDIAGSTVGISFLGTMCDSSSVGVSQDRHSSVDAVGSTAAHQLGHILNMNHDDGPS